MQVTIHGPQSTGPGFVVHEASCQDNGKDNTSGNPPWTIEASSKREIVEDIYGDQMSEGASYESCRGDINFKPCVDLPEEPAEQLPEYERDRLESRLPEYSTKAIENLADEDLASLNYTVSAEMSRRLRK